MQVEKTSDIASTKIGLSNLFNSFKHQGLIMADVQSQPERLDAKLCRFAFHRNHPKYRKTPK